MERKSGAGKRVKLNLAELQVVGEVLIFFGIRRGVDAAAAEVNCEKQHNMRDSGRQLVYLFVSVSNMSDWICS